MTQSEIIEGYFTLCKENKLNEMNSIGLEDFFELFRPFLNISIDDMKALLAREVIETKPRLIAEINDNTTSSIQRESNIYKIKGMADEEILAIAKRRCRRRLAIATIARYTELNSSEFLTIIFEKSK